VQLLPLGIACVSGAAASWLVNITHVLVRKAFQFHQSSGGLSKFLFSSQMVFSRSLLSHWGQKNPEPLKLSLYSNIPFKKTTWHCAQSGQIILFSFLENILANFTQEKIVLSKYLDFATESKRSWNPWTVAVALFSLHKKQL